MSALTLAACGRQVTPDRTTGGGPGGLPSGFMQVKFTTAGAMNFGTYSYVVMFNTRGNGVQPTAAQNQVGWAGFSFMVAIDGTGGSATASVYQGIPLQNSTVPQFQNVPFVPGQEVIFLLNTNGQNTQFSLQFRRSLASAFLSPSPGATPTPSSTPTPAPTPTPTPNPSPSSSPSASPSPTPTSSATPPPGTATIWLYNYFIVRGPASLVTSAIVDSLGSSPMPQNDTTYASQPLDTTASFDTGTFYPAASQLHGSNGDPASIIASGEIINSV